MMSTSTTTPRAEELQKSIWLLEREIDDLSVAAAPLKPENSLEAKSVSRENAFPVGFPGLNKLLLELEVGVLGAPPQFPDSADWRSSEADKSVGGRKI
jgi:hypothetical protein